MPHRYQQTSSLTPSQRMPAPRFFSAISEKFRQGYSIHDFKSDVMSGIVVGMVAVPLGMALAIASGVTPQQGLYTVIIAGILVALLGGSRFQVTGPTAAFVVVLVPIVHKYGVSGLLTAGFMAGIILLLMGIGRMGRLIQFIPYPVTTGFTTGIAVVIGTLQLKDFFGLTVDQMPESYLDKLKILMEAIPTFSFPSFAIGFSTLALLIVWPKFNKKIPSPLIVLGLITAITVWIKSRYPGISIDTIGSRFTYDVGGVIEHGIPNALPHIRFPWRYEDPPFAISLSTIKLLIPSAMVIAMLGAIESLLSAVVADGMARTKHDPDSELMALGLGNMVCPFFGGIPATGAIARTATNIRYGAKSPISAVIHGIFTMMVILLFAPYVSYLPMASLSALLLLVAYNMSEIRHFRHIIQIGPKSDVAVLLACTFLTVIFDMVTGVTVGVVLASLLFIKRMAQVTSSRILETKQEVPHENVPADVLLYDINGPLFFGAAEKAMETIDQINSQIKTVFLLMDGVPTMDITGLVALEGAVDTLLKHKRKVYLVGVKSQQRKLILRSELIGKSPNVFFCATIEDAIAHHKN